MLCQCQRRMCINIKKLLKVKDTVYHSCATTGTQRKLHSDISRERMRRQATKAYLLFNHWVCPFLEFITNYHLQIYFLSCNNRRWSCQHILRNYIHTNICTFLLKVFLHKNGIFENYFHSNHISLDILRGRNFNILGISPEYLGIFMGRFWDIQMFYVGYPNIFRCSEHPI